VSSVSEKPPYETVEWTTGSGGRETAERWGETLRIDVSHDDQLGLDQLISDH
jgi:hypothetical protein